MSHRKVILTTIFVILPAVALLLWLGTWQLQRLAWKSDLIEMRDVNYAEAPVPVPVRDHKLERSGWRRVSTTGTFHHMSEFHLWRIRDGAPGYEVLTPLEPADPGFAQRSDVNADRQVLEAGMSAAPLLVDRGWVPVDLKDPSARREGQIGGEVTVAGYIRTDLDLRGTATPDNEPENNIWYFVDYAAMSARDGTIYRPAVLVADETPNPGGWPLGSTGVPSLPNRHLGYAFTWYSLAAAAAVIWALVLRRRRREEAVA